MKQRVGIGIIGTGFARRVQIPVFRMLEDTEIVSIASASLENAVATAAEFGITHFSDDWRHTAGHPDVDLVCITTPPDLHREMVMYSLDRHKHILCEKPMAMNVAEAAEMAAGVKADRIAVIDHELRFQPGRLLAREMILAGEIGRVTHAKAIFRTPHRGDPDLPWDWWSNASAGGGALGAIGSHVIDTLQWMLCTQISSVSCQLHSHVKERRDPGGTMRAVTTDDEAGMLVRFGESEFVEDGTGLVSVSMVEQPDYRNRTEFYGTAGAIRIEHRGEVFITRAGDDKWHDVEVDLGETLQSYPDTGFSRGFVAFAPELISAVQYGRPVVEHAATFEDGLTVQRVIDAALESHKTGRVVLVGK